MHSYSIDSAARSKVYVTLALFSAGLPAGMAEVTAWAHQWIAAAPTVTWPVSFGATFGFLFAVFDRRLWRARPFTAWHSIPNLVGTWEASGVSSFKETPESPNHTFTMKVIIKQTFTKLEVFTETAESTSRSTMASIDSDHAVATSVIPWTICACCVDAASGNSAKLFRW